MLAGICTHAHAHADPEEEKGPRSLEEEQTHSPSTAESTGKHHNLRDGKLCPCASGTPGMTLA